jgi:hypothetical protein
MGENKQLYRNSVKKAGKSLDEDGGRVARAAKIGINTVAAGMDVFRAKVRGEFASLKDRADRLEQSQTETNKKVEALEDKVSGVETVAARAAGNAVSGMESRLGAIEKINEELGKILNTEVTLENGKKLSGVELLAEAVKTGSVVLQEWFRKQLTATQNVQEIVEAAVNDAVSKSLAKLGATVVRKEEKAKPQSEVDVSDVEEPDGVMPEGLASAPVAPVSDVDEPDGVMPEGLMSAPVSALSADEEPDIEVLGEEAELGEKLKELASGLKKALVTLGYEVPADEESQMSHDEMADDIDAGMKMVLESLGYDMSNAEDGDGQKTLAQKVENLEQGLVMINDEIKNKENEGEQ